MAYVAEKKRQKNIEKEIKKEDTCDDVNDESVFGIKNEDSSNNNDSHNNMTGKADDESNINNDSNSNGNSSNSNGRNETSHDDGISSRETIDGEPMQESVGKIDDPCPAISFTNAGQLFAWIRGAPTDDSLMSRLDFIAQELPDTAEYVNDYLRPSRRYWALCHQVGHLTFGLISTSVQESLHASLKTMLNGQKIAIHRIVEFFRLWYDKRDLNHRLKNHSNLRIKTKGLREQADRMGANDLAQSMQILLIQ